MTSSMHPFFQQPDEDDSRKVQKFFGEDTIGDEYNFPDKWISFILKLPSILPNHSAQWIVDIFDRLWDTILHRLTLAGAQSFSAWWITKVFFHETMLWQVEKGGFVKHTSTSLQSTFSASQSTVFINHVVRHSSQPRLIPSLSEQKDPNPVDALLGDSGIRTEASINQGNNTSNERDENDATETGQISADLKETHGSISEPLGELRVVHNDDSGIDLGEDSMLISVSKYGDMMASDSAEAGGDMVIA